jgi:hypothetical protein
MRRLIQTSQSMPRERLAEVVSAAGYGSVLVLAALSVIGVSEVALGHGAELVAGVGVATWLAHVFAEILGDHVRHPEPSREPGFPAEIDDDIIQVARTLEVLPQRVCVGVEHFGGGVRSEVEVALEPPWNFDFARDG